MGVIVLKLGLLFSMVLLTVVAGLSPILLLRVLRKKAATAQTTRKQKYVSLVLCMLTCFSGGVFLATCFLHLFPELSDHLNEMRQKYDFNFDYPLAELLSCMGFFVLFFLEEAVLYLVPSMAHGHGHIHGSHGHSHDEDDLFSTGSTKDVKDGNESGIKRILKHGDEITDVSSKLLSNASDPATESNHKVVVETTLINELPYIQAKAVDSENTLRCMKVTSCVKTECSRPFLALEFAEPERCETNCEGIKEDPPIRMKSMPHAHSHGTRSVTIVLAIAFHAIIEGLALGVQEDPPKIWAIFISLTVHKLIVAFSVGLQLARTHAHNINLVVISMVLISFMTPIGGVLGMLVQNAPIDGKYRDIIVLICQGLAVGTFIYVTFFEVLIHERDNEHPNLLKLAMMLLGFAFIGLIRLLAEDHSHSASTGSHHHHFHEVDGHNH